MMQQCVVSSAFSLSSSEQVLSHVFGVTASFLLRQISSVLAMNTCIPIVSWVGITLIYQVGSCISEAVAHDVDAQRDVANLV
ncbi:hypothetical protein Bca101_019511 [Brassica carinata]